MTYLTISHNALARSEFYYASPPDCPLGSNPVEYPIGNVNPDLLPTHKADQGSTGSCGFHSGMVLVNALYKYNRLKENPSEKIHYDLSIFDAIMKTGKCDSTEDSSMRAKTNPVPFLIQYSKLEHAEMNQDGQTVKDMDDQNKALIQAREDCDSSCDNTDHSTCFENIYQENKEIIKHTDDWRKLASAIKENKEMPIKIVHDHKKPNKVAIPPYQIRPWDFFLGRDISERRSSIKQTIVDYFKKPKDPLLPLLLNTCVEADTDMDGCSPGQGHGVAATKITQVKCMNKRGKLVQTSYKVWTANSWGAESEGPYDLEKIVNGMEKAKFGIVAIEPPSTEQKGGVLIEQKQGYPLFHYAEAGDLENVQKLIPRISNLNTQMPSDGSTPLLIAAESGHLGIVKALLEAKAQVQQTDLQGSTPLYAAAAHGHVKIVEALLEAKAPVDPLSFQKTTPLCIAAEEGHTEVVKALLKKNADINYVTKEGWTPLLLAVHQEHLDIVTALLTHGNLPTDEKNQINVNKRLPDGSTPLLLATERGSEDLVRTLIKLGQANVNLGTKTRLAPLHMAASQGLTNIASILLENKADINVTNREGWTPLNLAADRGHLPLVKLLIENKAGTDNPNEDGFSPLAQAVFKGHFEVAQELLKAGADPTKAGNDRRTIESLAKEPKKSNSTQLIQLLKEYKKKFTSDRNLEL